jgi:methyl-accepting chemotaxis protein
MATTVTTDQSIVSDLARYIIKLDELAIRVKGKQNKKDIAKRADQLRDVHLKLFAAEFNASTANLAAATKAVRLVSAEVANTIDDIAQVAATLRSVARLIDAGTALAAKAAKIALI